MRSGTGNIQQRAIVVSSIRVNQASSHAGRRATPCDLLNCACQMYAYMLGKLDSLHVVNGSP